MTFLEQTNAETGIYNTENWSRLTTGNEVVRDNSVTPHGGSWSWCVGGDGIAKNSWWNLSTYTVGTWFIIRQWIRIGALPTSNQTFYPSIASGGNLQMSLALQTNGSLIGTTGIGNGYPLTASATMNSGEWHELEFASYYRTSNIWADSIYRLDGVEFQRFCGRMAISGYPNRLFTAALSTYPVRVNIDDVNLNNDSGSSSNWWRDGTKPVSAGKTQPSVRSVGASTTNSTQLRSIIINAPSTIVSGDTLVMVVFIVGLPGTLTYPPGWTQRVSANLQISTGNILVATKTATGSEPSTYTITTTNAVYCHAVCYSLASVDTSNPIIDAHGVGVGNQSTKISVMPALDLSEGDAQIFQAFANSNTVANSITTPSWWTNVTSLSESTHFFYLSCGFFGQSNGGLVGTDIVNTTANMVDSVGVSIAFRGVATVAAPQNKFLAVA